MTERQQRPLDEPDNAARIFFSQSARSDLRDRPRAMVAKDGNNWQPVTWGEMASRVEHLAAFLVRQGLDSGDKVAVFANTRLEWGLAGLAAVAARGVLVPVYPALVGEPLVHILAHSDSRILFVETEDQLRRVLEVWNQLSIRTLIGFDSMDLSKLAKEAGLEDAGIAENHFTLAQAEKLGAASLRSAPKLVNHHLDAIRLEDPGYLIYTSGTTGMPKGVVLSHRNVAVSAGDWIALNGPRLHEGDIDVLWLPMSHIFGWGQFGLGNQLGFVTYFSEPLKALEHLQALAAHIFMSVPAYWEKLALMAQSVSANPLHQRAELRRLTGGRLRFCLSGGAGLGREVKELFKSAGMMIIEGYGLTECAPTLTMNRIDDYDFDSVGKPFPSVQVKIAGDGEILAKGDNLFLGYYKDDEATASMYDAEGWFRTGDLGRFNERGFLQIIGRKKEILVTSGGKNIPPQNIESRFRDEPLISQVVVYGNGKKYLVALVDIDEQVALERLGNNGEAPCEAPRQHPLIQLWVQEQIDKVNRELARYETIKHFCIADEPLSIEGGFLTPSLKVRRGQVEDHFRAALEALYLS